MEINSTMLNNLLECNKHIKLKFKEDSNILEILIYNKVYTCITLSSKNLNNHSSIIYNTLVSLDNINIYIPKIYIKE
ncbi:MAG: hypothetical protein RRZ84_03965 [Romboutsia sp.]